jgi:hypothetical protein
LNVRDVLPFSINLDQRIERSEDAPEPGAELSEAELETVAGGITDIRAILGRQENFFTPRLMTKRKTADPDK